MTHEEYLIRLIRGFAGDPHVPRQPEYSGSSEPDAVARWLSYHVAMYSMENCGFVPSRQGVSVLPAEVKTWSRWATSRMEDVDMTLAGILSGNSDVVTHQIKVKVTPASARRYFFRLSNWRLNQHLDVEGENVQLRSGRILIDDVGSPLRWRAGQQGRTAPTRAVPLQACCRTAMREIGRIMGRDRGYTSAALPFQVMENASPVPSVTGGARRSGRLPDANLDIAAHRAIREIITRELTNHHGNGRLRTYWERVHAAHSGNRDQR